MNSVRNHEKKRPFLRRKRVICLEFLNFKELKRGIGRTAKIKLEANF